MTGLFVFRICLAGFIGVLMGLMGARREDVRTYALIAMGAALVSVISTEFFKALDNPWVADPGRLAAQVVAALGFLGAGFIWVNEKGKIRGLAGAAGLWVVAIMGILVGSGLKHVSVAASFFVLMLFWISGLLTRKKDKDDTV